MAVGAGGRYPGDGLVVALWRSTHAQGKGSSDAAVAGIGLRDTLPGQMSDDYTGGVGVLVVPGDITGEPAAHPTGRTSFTPPTAVVVPAPDQVRALGEISAAIRNNLTPRCTAAMQAEDAVQVS